jgi:hypothetical protein
VKLPSYRVAIKAHEVERWRIPASEVEVPAASPKHARLIVVRAAHAAVGVPPWKPCVRASLAHTSAEVVRQS